MDTIDLRRDLQRQAAGNMASQLEDEIRSSLDARLPDGWTLDNIRTRASCQTYRSEPDWEYYCLDGEPMFKIGPIKLSNAIAKNDSYIQTITRDVVRFKPAPTAPSQLKPGAGKEG